MNTTTKGGTFGRKRGTFKETEQLENLTEQTNHDWQLTGKERLQEWNKHKILR